MKCIKINVIVFECIFEFVIVKFKCVLVFGKVFEIDVEGDGGGGVDVVDGVLFVLFLVFFELCVEFFEFFDCFICFV